MTTDPPLRPAANPPEGGDDPVRPGEVVLARSEVEIAPGRLRRAIVVRNDSRRVVRISSHYPFERANPRLLFDRALAVGFRLAIPAGASERWLPGEERVVELVRYGGAVGRGGERAP